MSRKIIIASFLALLSNIALSKDYFSLKTRVSFPVCRLLNPGDQSGPIEDTYNLGAADGEGKCLDDPSKDCAENITFFSLSTSATKRNTQGLVKNKSEFCFNFPDSSKCFESTFKIEQDDNKLFFTIIDQKFSRSSTPYYSKKFQLTEQMALNRWKKFAQFSDGCDYTEIEFLFNKR